MTADAKGLAKVRQRREALGLHDLLTTPETAARLHVSESFLKKGRRNGRADLPPAVRVGHRVMYRRSDVEQWAHKFAQGVPYDPKARR